MDWKPSDDEKRNVRLYWYAVLDEWVATTCFKTETEFMWDELYRNGVVGALSMPNGVFEEVLCDMIGSGTTFLGKRAEFIAEINAICHEALGQSLNVSEHEQSSGPVDD